MISVAPRISELWVYLAASPLLGLTLTLLAYQLAFVIYKRSGGNPLANPLAIAVALVVAVLSVTGTPYRTYFDGAQFVHFLLGPATVALAIPLYTQVARLKRMLLPLLAALIVGSLTACVSAVAIGWALGASTESIRSLAPKSITTPIAMGVAEKIGGLPSLTAVLVVVTGIFGAISASYLFNALRIKDPVVRGFAIGVSAHGIGTARAFQVSEETGAFSALAMCLNGIATALFLPLLFRVFGG
jgi:predicted murein hydrolase (TIGR00659 family)